MGTKSLWLINAQNAEQSAGTFIETSIGKGVKLRLISGGNPCDAIVFSWIKLGARSLPLRCKARGERLCSLRGG